MADTIPQMQWEKESTDTLDDWSYMRDSTARVKWQRKYAAYEVVKEYDGIIAYCSIKNRTGVVQEGNVVLTERTPDGKKLVHGTVFDPAAVEGLYCKKGDIVKVQVANRRGEEFIKKITGGTMPLLKENEVKRGFIGFYNKESAWGMIYRKDSSDQIFFNINSVKQTSLRNYLLAGGAPNMIKVQFVPEYDSENERWAAYHISGINDDDLIAKHAAAARTPTTTASEPQSDKKVEEKVKEMEGKLKKEFDSMGQKFRDMVADFEKSDPKKLIDERLDKCDATINTALTHIGEEVSGAVSQKMLELQEENGAEMAEVVETASLRQVQFMETAMQTLGQMIGKDLSIVMDEAKRVSQIKELMPRSTYSMQRRTKMDLDPKKSSLFPIRPDSKNGRLTGGASKGDMFIGERQSLKSTLNDGRWLSRPDEKNSFPGWFPESERKAPGLADPLFSPTNFTSAGLFGGSLFGQDEGMKYPSPKLVPDYLKCGVASDGAFNEDSMSNNKTADEMNVEKEDEVKIESGGSGVEMKGQGSEFSLMDETEEVDGIDWGGSNRSAKNVAKNSKNLNDRKSGATGMNKKAVITEKQSKRKYEKLSNIMQKKVTGEQTNEKKQQMTQHNTAASSSSTSKAPPDVADGDEEKKSSSVAEKEGVIAKEPPIHKVDEKNSSSVTKKEGESAEEPPIHKVDPELPCVSRNFG